MTMKISRNWNDNLYEHEHEQEHEYIHQFEMKFATHTLTEYNIILYEMRERTHLDGILYNISWKHINLQNKDTSKWKKKQQEPLWIR